MGTVRFPSICCGPRLAYSMGLWPVAYSMPCGLQHGRWPVACSLGRSHHNMDHGLQHGPRASGLQHGPVAYSMGLWPLAWACGIHHGPPYGTQPGPYDLQHEPTA